MNKINWPSDYMFIRNELEWTTYYFIKSYQNIYIIYNKHICNKLHIYDICEKC